MNAILFGMKRSFQASIRFTRSAVAAFGLTAARFDMLYAIKSSYKIHDVRQSDLRRSLGVTAPTVSRMLRSLEKLGFVSRVRPTSGDTRQRIVSLTSAGLACIRRAFRSLVRRRTVRRAFDAVLTVGQPLAAWLVETEIAESVCWRIRRGFGDIATLGYPWHPDD
jgi:DNA-binding MarR family transcriptional regulator